MSMRQVRERAGHIRTPPQDLESEQAVLGAMIIEPQAIRTVSGICKAEDFYREANLKIFRAIMALDERHEGVDVLTLTNELKKMGEWDAVGGLSTVSALIERVEVAANVEYHAWIVRDKAASRRFISAAANCIADAYAEALPIKEFLESAEKRIFDATQLRAQFFPEEIPDLHDVLVDVKEKVDAARRGEGARYIKTGLWKYDQEFEGAERGAFTVFSAPPKIGKSMFFINVALSLMQRGEKVAYIILDMQRQAIVRRMISNISGATLQQMHSPEYAIGPVELAYDTFSRMKANLLLAGQETVDFEFDRIRRWIATVCRKFGVKMVLIDSVSRIYTKAERWKTEESYIAQMVGDIQALAIQFDIPIWGICELNYEGKEKGSSAWSYRPGNVIGMELRDGKFGITSKHLRDHAPAQCQLVAKYEISRLE